MALTKVAGDILDPGIVVSGIVTATAFDGPFRGGSDSDIIAGILTATNLDINGNGDISGNLVVHGNLTANGDFTTLNTTLREVELLRVDASSGEPAGIITQTGAGDLLRLYDGTSQVVTVDDEGNVGLGSAIPAKKLDVNGTSQFQDDITFIDGYGNSNHVVYDKSQTALVFPSGPTSGTNFPAIIIGDRTSGGNTKLYSDYWNTHFKHVGAGGFVLSSTTNAISIQGANGSDGVQTSISIPAGATAGVKLYQAGSIRLETVGYGVTVFGTTETQKLNVTGISTLTGDVKVGSGITFHATNSRISLPDGTTGHPYTGNLEIGSGRDFTIVHDSNHTYMTNRTGDLYIGISDSVFPIQLKSNNTAEIYHGSTKVLNTTSTGVGINTTLKLNGAAGDPGKLILQEGGAVSEIRVERSTDTSSSLLFGTEISGTTATRWKIDTAGHFIPSAVGTYNIGSTGAEIGNVFLADSKKVFLGSDQDAEIYHNGSHGYLTNTTGNLFVANTGTNYTYVDSNFFRIRDSSGNHMFDVNSGGGHQGVGLYYSAGTQGTEKLRTSATGITVTGEVVATQDYPNYRPEFDFNFAATKKLDPRMTFTRTGEASFHDGVGSVKFVGDNEPRFDHDIVTGKCKGLLVEPAGTNYSWYSRRFDAINTGSWIKVNSASITGNTHTAPDGTSSGVYMADTISGATGTTFNGNVLRQQVTAGAGVKHTFSIYVKLLTSTQATIYVRDGATGSTATANAVNTKDWQRVVVTSTNALTNGTVHSFYVGNTNGDIAVWGAQIERSSYASSYIKTDTGVNGTRAADFPRLETEDFTDMISQEAGTFITEFDNQSNDGYVLSLDAGGNPKIGMVNSDGYQLMGTQDNGGSLGTTDNGTVLDGINKFALAYEVNNAAISINGNNATVDTSYTPLPTTTYLWFGLRQGQYDHLGGAISRVIYYKQRLSNSQLKTLTS